MRAKVVITTEKGEEWVYFLENEKRLHAVRDILDEIQEKEMSDDA